MFLLSLPEAMCLHDVWKDDVPSSGTLPPCLYCRHSVCFWGLLWKWWTVEGGGLLSHIIILLIMLRSTTALLHANTGCSLQKIRVYFICKCVLSTLGPGKNIS